MKTSGDSKMKVPLTALHDGRLFKVWPQVSLLFSKNKKKTRKINYKRHIIPNKKKFLFVPKKFNYKLSLATK